MTQLRRFFPITKVDDEQRMVYGYASTEALDSQGEVIARTAIIDALPDYMRFANIREMHTMSAVGVAKAAEVDDKGLYIAAKVVDDTAWEKVKEGVYKGFSVGGKGLAKADGVITKMRLAEISLVDRPANPECVIDCFKADGADEAATEEGPGTQAGEQGQGLPSEPVAKAGEGAQQLAEPLPVPEVVELSKLPPELAEQVKKALTGGDLAKRGARYSAATKGALAKVHGMLRDCDKAMGDLGYDKDEPEDNDTGKAAESELAKALDAELLDVAKGAGFELKDGALYADLLKSAITEVGTLRKRVKELEDEPAPRKAAATVVGKADDDSLGRQQPLQADPNDPLAVFKAVHARPRLITSRGITE